MSVIVEFTIAAEAFGLGRALSGRGKGTVELERIVPADNSVVPFFWMKGGEHDALEADVDASEYVENLTVMDRVGDHTLYRVTWTGKEEPLIHGIASNEGTILDARSNGNWSFQLRFLDHQHLAEFYNHCTEHDVGLQVDRVYTLTEESLQGRVFGLTDEQREALVLALEAGYFATPRETTMEELATRLDISQQAFSDRLRRGTEKVLRNALLE